MSESEETEVKTKKTFDAPDKKDKETTVEETTTVKESTPKEAQD